MMASKNFKTMEYLRVEELIKEGTIFNGDKGQGIFRKKVYPFVLQDADNNLFLESENNIKNYFKNNQIDWWGGKLPNHTLSSQVACVNHLFPIREDKEAVLSLVKEIDSDIKDILLIQSDKYMPAYIQFEAVSDYDNLNEKYSTRGSNCTSVDALIYGVRENEEKVLFLIEWKYTETYGNTDKAKGNDGTTRKERYTTLIEQSDQLKNESQDVYYFEPFYQLMRQTLWAEQIISNQNRETLKANDYIHIHVIPSENTSLLNKSYPSSGKNMEETWRSSLNDQSKYVVVSPKDFIKSIDKDKYRLLLEYLDRRYW